MIDISTIDSAKEKHYTAFSNSIKQNLLTKLSNNEVIKNYTNEIDKIETMRDSFANISQISKN